MGNLAKLGPVYANPPVPRAREVRLQQVVEQRLTFWEITMMHDILNKGACVVIFFLDLQGARAHNLMN
jgi:hypothetical protein